MRWIFCQFSYFCFRFLLRFLLQSSSLTWSWWPHSLPEKKGRMFSFLFQGVCALATNTNYCQTVMQMRICTALASYQRWLSPLLTCGPHMGRLPYQCPTPHNSPLNLIGAFPPQCKHGAAHDYFCCCWCLCCWSFFFFFTFQEGRGGDLAGRIHKDHSNIKSCETKISTFFLKCCSQRDVAGRELIHVSHIFFSQGKKKSFPN